MISASAAAAFAAASALAGAACGAAAARHSPTMAEPERSAELLPRPAAAEDDFDAPGLENRVLRKAETVVRGRTGRFLIVVERCCNSHNYSAIIRTAEALGVQHIWLIDPQPQTASSAQAFAADAHELNEHNAFARKATDWTTIREFSSTAECLVALKAAGRTLWATDLSQHARCLRAPSDGSASPDGSGLVVPEKLAIAFGTESVGCTEELLQAADVRVYLPLRGFADSLNLSVAAALVLHQLFHMCPEAVGDLSEADRHGLRAAWFPRLMAQRAGTPAQYLLHDMYKRMRWLREKLEKVGPLKAKAAKAAEATASGATLQHNDRLSAAQQSKIEQEPAWLEELARIEAAVVATVASNAAADTAIAHPPQPLGDMRRADAHRAAFAGSGVRRKNKEHWEGMAAMQ